MKKKKLETKQNKTVKQSPLVNPLDNIKNPFFKFVFIFLNICADLTGLVFSLVIFCSIAYILIRVVCGLILWWKVAFWFQHKHIVWVRVVLAIMYEFTPESVWVWYDLIFFIYREETQVGFAIFLGFNMLYYLLTPIREAAERLKAEKEQMLKEKEKDIKKQSKKGV